MNTISNEQAWEILKKYDESCYEYYKNNAHLFGWSAKNYAEYLLKKNEKIENVKECNISGQ